MINARDVGDHPDVVSAMRTGYPRDLQPNYTECDVCHDELDQDECYQDELYDCLCENCLLTIHKKGCSSCIL